MGESYFNQKKYKEAIPYLKAYTGKKGKWNNYDYYQLGYVYFMQNDFGNAISYFNKIIDQKNSVSQNAYYHLAEYYLNTDKKTEALNAFASGLNEKNYSVTLTRGIINTLDDKELEGVIAHELTHIINRDVRLLIISIIFVGIFSLHCRGPRCDI